MEVQIVPEAGSDGVCKGRIIINLTIIRAIREGGFFYGSELRAQGIGLKAQIHIRQPKSQYNFFAQ